MYCNKALFEVLTFFYAKIYIGLRFSFYLRRNKANSPGFPYCQYENIDIQPQQMNDDECLAEFRVKRPELNALAEVLIIPGRFRCPNGTVASGFEALCCIILRRFS